MKANNLTISIPTPPCKMGCPYCITNMTGRIDKNSIRFRSNIKKAKKIADNADITNILVTGKGEPLDNLFYLDFVRRTFKDYPLEIQINGNRYLNSNDNEMLNQFDIIALSFDRIPGVFQKKNDNLFRATFVIHDGWSKESFRNIIDFCKVANIDQFSLRNPTIPENSIVSESSYAAMNWIKDNTLDNNYDRLIMESRDFNPVLIRKMEFGARIYDIEGVSFSYFDYCVQDKSDDGSIRSLIYMEDGHMYTSWSYKSSKLF